MRQMHGTLETNKNLDHDHEAVACSRHVLNYFLTCLIHTTSVLFLCPTTWFDVTYPFVAKSVVVVRKT